MGSPTVASNCSHRVRQPDQAINVLEADDDCCTSNNPEYTCLLLGAKSVWTTRGYERPGGNGRCFVSTLAWLAATYFLGDERPLSGQPAHRGAKGGPGWQAGLWFVARRLPETAVRSSSRTPVRTGAMAANRHRVPGPTQLAAGARAVPEPPRHPKPVRRAAPGPIPYPGGPAYGAPMYAPDGTPLGLACRLAAAGAQRDPQGPGGRRLRAVRGPAPDADEATPLPPIHCRRGAHRPDRPSTNHPTRRQPAMSLRGDNDL